VIAEESLVSEHLPNRPPLAETYEPTADVAGRLFKEAVEVGILYEGIGEEQDEGVRSVGGSHSLRRRPRPETAGKHNDVPRYFFGFFGFFFMDASGGKGFRGLHDTIMSRRAA
jgi:hypothetical protein